MGLVLTILLAAAAAYFAVANHANTVDFYLVNGYLRVEGVPLWSLLCGSAGVTAVVAWLFQIRAARQFKRRIAERETELQQVRQRLQQTQDSLHQYEDKIHEFALKIVSLAALPPTSATPQRAEEIAQRALSATVLDDADTGELAALVATVERTEQSEQREQATPAPPTAPAAAPVAAPPAAADNEMIGPDEPVATSTRDDDDPDDVI